MDITTRGGKYTIDPPILFEVKKMVEKDKDEVVVIGETEVAAEK